MRKIYQMKLDLNELFAILKFVAKIETSPKKEKIMEDI